MRVRERVREWRGNNQQLSPTASATTISTSHASGSALPIALPHAMRAGGGGIVAVNGCGLYCSLQQREDQEHQLVGNRHQHCRWLMVWCQSNGHHGCHCLLDVLWCLVVVVDLPCWLQLYIYTVVAIQSSHQLDTVQHGSYIHRAVIACASCAEQATCAADCWRSCSRCQSCYGSVPLVIGIAQVYDAHTFLMSMSAPWSIRSNTVSG
jgi:hypothetical protein